MASQLAAWHAPSAESLAHRARIANILRSLRDVTPRVPFWQLASHRIPTLWTLYRGLLRNAPADIVKSTIRWEFHRYRHLTGPNDTKEQLQRLHRWMDIFIKARDGDAHEQAIVQRYVRMLEARRDKDIFADMLRDQFAWQERLRTRPRLTGSFLRSTLYNRPMPRLKPQPINLTGILVSRHKKRIIRQAQLDHYQELRQDLQRECEFEAKLEEQGLEFTKDMSQNVKEMSWYLQSRISTINETFERDVKRIQSPYAPELLKTVHDARRFKVENKTRERLREERGEILPITIRRARKRPPPHVFAKMTEKQRRWDIVARSSVSEVGYIGYVKKMLGWKLRKPDAWKVEFGRPENKPILAKVDALIRKENERRRTIGESEESGSGTTSAENAN